MTIIEETLRFVLYKPLSCIASPFIRAVTVRLERNQDWRPRPEFSIPVLDVSSATSLYFSIRQATEDDVDYKSDIEVPDLWLSCLVAGQFTSDRLLVELRNVDYHLHFWQNRLREGGVQRFLVFSRGPIKFFEAILNFLHLMPTDRRPLLKPNDRIEQRLLTLRTIRAELAVALARVHHAVRALHVSPKFVEVNGRPSGNGDGQVEEVEGSTAWSVAQAAEICSRELLYVATHLDALGKRIGALDDSRDTVAEQRRMLTVGSHPVMQMPKEEAPPELRRGRPSIRREMAEALPESMAASQARLQQWSDHFHLRMALDSPAEGLKAATRVAHRAGRAFISLPSWVCAPSRLQRHWLRYTVNSAVSLAALRFLALHSPLCGSTDLQDWAMSCVSVVQKAVRDNVLRPLATVRDEFFETFQARSSIVSRADFELSKASLQRMLNDFEHDTAGKPVAGGHAVTVADGQEREGALPGMENLMRHYEAELRAPIRNAISGTLPRSLLIQVQKLKVDTESAMLEMDQILRSNELTMAVTAALPALLLAGGAVAFLLHILRPRPVDLHAQAAPARLAMTDLERAIDALLATSAVQKKRSAVGEDGDEDVDADPEMWEEQGNLLLHIARVRAQTGRVYARSAGRITLTRADHTRELEQIDSDLFAMAAATSVTTKARVAERMHRAYSIYRA